MSADTLRQVMANKNAAQAATREAKEITAKAYSEANATIRTLESRRPAPTQSKTAPTPVKK